MKQKTKLRFKEKAKAALNAVKKPFRKTALMLSIMGAISGCGDTIVNNHYYPSSDGGVSDSGSLGKLDVQSKDSLPKQFDLSSRDTSQDSISHP